MTILVGQFVLLAVLLLLSGFFSSSETGFFSLNPLQVRRLETTHPGLGGRVREILARPTRLLSTILVGNTVVNIAASSLGYKIAERLELGRAELVSVFVMTGLLLVFGEIGPKRVAMLWSEKLVLWYAPLLSVADRMVSPVRVLLGAVTHGLEPHFRRRGGTLTEAEFAAVVDLSGEEGTIDEDESAMVRSIIGLENLQASDVMTPRVDIAGIDLDEISTLSVDRIREASRRYLALYRDRLDRVEGFLDVRAFLLDPGHRLSHARIEPVFVPETARLDGLVARFWRNNHRVAVVVDEYGGTAGMITRGDLLDEIMGEIDDEFTGRRTVLDRMGPRRWLVDASTSLETLREQTGIALAAPGADRLAGWVAAKAERLPEVGASIEADGLRVEVRQRSGHRITLVMLEELEGDR